MLRECVYNEGMNTNTATTYTVRVPAMFWADHIDRGCTPAISERQSGSSVWLILDDAAITDLYSDAVYYIDDEGCPDLARLARSARRTVDNIRKQQPEWCVAYRTRRGQR